MNQGVPFREAYKTVGDQIEKGEFHFDNRSLHHTHEGSIGNLMNDKITLMMDNVIKKFD